MARKRYSDEGALRLLREIDVHLHDGMDVAGTATTAFCLQKFVRYLFLNSSDANFSSPRFPISILL